MKKHYIVSILITCIIFFSACEDCSKYIAYSTYQSLQNNFTLLAKRYRNLQSDYSELKKTNEELIKQNKEYRDKLKAWECGFESMYGIKCDKKIDDILKKKYKSTSKSLFQSD
jgi:FtsZ-binding cell division protein ZapB